MGTKCRFPDAVMAAENPAHCGLRLAKNPSKISTGKSLEIGRKSWENVENNDDIYLVMNYRHPVKKSPSLHGLKSNPNPKYLVTAEAYFVCHIGPKFQISFIHAFIGCP